MGFLSVRGYDKNEGVSSVNAYQFGQALDFCPFYDLAENVEATICFR